jgi:hypothetical protein
MNAEAGAGRSSVLLLQSMSVDIGYDGRIDVPNLVEPQIPLHIIHKVVRVTCKAISTTSPPRIVPLTRLSTKCHRQTWAQRPDLVLVRLHLDDGTTRRLVAREEHEILACQGISAGFR